jgi:hypothetical protein
MAIANFKTAQEFVGNIEIQQEISVQLKHRVGVS